MSQSSEATTATLSPNDAVRESFVAGVAVVAPVLVATFAFPVLSDSSLSSDESRTLADDRVDRYDGAVDTESRDQTDSPSTAPDDVEEADE